jgi:hypothetical protein
MGGMKYLGQATITPQNLAHIQKTWPFNGEGYVQAFGKVGQAVCVEGEVYLLAGGRVRRDFDALKAELSGMGVLFEAS